MLTWSSRGVRSLRNSGVLMGLVESWWPESLGARRRAALVRRLNTERHKKQFSCLSPPRFSLILPMVRPLVGWRILRIMRRNTTGGDDRLPESEDLHACGFGPATWILRRRRARHRHRRAGARKVRAADLCPPRDRA